MRLYDLPRSAWCQMVRIVLAEKGLPHERLVVLPGQEEEEWFLGLNPSGSLPVLVDHDLPVREAAVIDEYLEEAYPDRPLLPDAPADRARVRQLVYLAEELGHVLEDLYLTLELEHETDPELLEDLRDEVFSQLELVSHEIDGLTWAAGSHFSLADAALAPMLLGLLREVDMAGALDELPNVKAYAGRLAARPSAAVVGVAWGEWREMLAQLAGRGQG